MIRRASENDRGRGRGRGEQRDTELGIDVPEFLPG
jgi:hypothetical protein